MKYAFLSILGLCTLLAIPPSSTRELKQAETAVYEELGLKCTAQALCTVGDYTRVAVTANDVNFTVNMLDNKYVSDNYSEASYRYELLDVVTNTVSNNGCKLTPYVDVYGTNLVVYLLGDGILPVSCIRDIAGLVYDSKNDYTAYLCVSKVSSGDLGEFEQLSQNWFGIGNDTQTFYNKIDPQQTVSFSLIDTVPTEYEIAVQLSNIN
ncbi:MAG: hypothetical protein NC548_10900 [Lachnospiraceae bacterium]|nr:hypothetical protein [Lachnospiraceae bacterium]MCM1235274.1 hypothetical protein [Ruminococcus flavefaciens]